MRKSLPNYYKSLSKINDTRLFHSGTNFRTLSLNKCLLQLKLVYICPFEYPYFETSHFWFQSSVLMLLVMRQLYMQCIIVYTFTYVNKYKNIGSYKSVSWK